MDVAFKDTPRWQLPFLLKIVNEVTYAQIQCVGDLPQSLQCDLLLGALDFADVIAVEVGLFRQLLLTEMGLLALFTNCFPDDPIKLL